jgi:hypothetical protein
MQLSPDIPAAAKSANVIIAVHMAVAGPAHRGDILISGLMVWKITAKPKSGVLKARGLIEFT